MIDTDDNVDLTDSDDDLLGLSSDPLIIRTLRRPLITTQTSPQTDRRSVRAMTQEHSQSRTSQCQSTNIRSGSSSSVNTGSNCIEVDSNRCHTPSDNNDWLPAVKHRSTRRKDQRPSSPKDSCKDCRIQSLAGTSDQQTPAIYRHKINKNIHEDAPIKISLNSVKSNQNCNKDLSDIEPLTVDESSDIEIPTMEVIDLNTVKGDPKISIDFGHGRWSNIGTLNGICVNKASKYQRMREIRNVTGFIVNVHDATNFDIDIDITPELHEKYRDVISNQYTYQDLGSDFLDNPDLNRLIKISPEVGTTYRCRLKGVGINQLSQSEHTWRTNQMCVDVKQLIDRTDGWITCNLSDIDVYRRLLVDITVHTGNGPVNLRDYLLNKVKNDDTPIFYPYSGKNMSGSLSYTRI